MKPNETPEEWGERMLRELQIEINNISEESFKQFLIAGDYFEPSITALIHEYKRNTNNSTDQG